MIDCNQILGSLRGVVAGSKKLLAKLEKLGDHCPTCEQDVDSEFKQSLIDAETKRLQKIEGKNMKLKEEYQKLSETMPSMTMPEKLKESGKKFIEVLIELYQWPSWTKKSLKAAWEEYELTWFKHKSLWKRQREK